MPLAILTKTLIAASATNIAASQTPTGPMALVGGGTVTLDTQRRVLITSAANIAGTNFLISGTRDTGQAVSETLGGPNASTVQSLYDYRTITSIVPSGTPAGALTVGTSAVGASDWKNINTRASVFSMTIACTVNGSVNYSIETTNSRTLATPNFPTLSINPLATSIANATASATLTLAAIFRAWRVVVLSGTGSVTVEAEQLGI